MKKFLLAAAALSMSASPVLAAKAASTPIAKSTRATADKGKSDLLGGGAFVAVIAAIAIIVGIIIVANEDDKPNSP